MVTALPCVCLSVLHRVAGPAVGAPFGHTHVCVCLFAQALDKNKQEIEDLLFAEAQQQLEYDDDADQEFVDDEDEDENKPSPFEPDLSLDEQQQLAAEAAELSRLRQDLQSLSGAEREARFRKVEEMMKDIIVTKYRERFTRISVPKDHWSRLCKLLEAGVPIYVLVGSFETLASEMEGEITAENPDGTLKSPVWNYAKDLITEPVFDALILMNAMPIPDHHDAGVKAWSKLSPTDLARIAHMQAVALQVRAVAAAQRGEFERPSVLACTFAAGWCDPPRLFRRQAQELLQKAKRLLCSFRAP